MRIMYRKTHPGIIVLNEKTAYLAGAIIGDGHLDNAKRSNDSYYEGNRIKIDISDKDYMKDIFNIVKSLVITRTKLYNPEHRLNRKSRLCMSLRNKELFIFFNKFLGIPSGRKSQIVRIPNKIVSSTIDIKKNFLAGYFDTNGGFRGGTLGFTTASNQLQIDTSKLLHELEINHSLEEWIYPKYNTTYYGIRLKKGEIDKFLKILPLRNFEKLERIKIRFDVHH